MYIKNVYNILPIERLRGSDCQSITGSRYFDRKCCPVEICSVSTVGFGILTDKVVRYFIIYLLCSLTPLY